ncbi:MAG: 2-amino-4-hydroxy-6-hydroxymethyldihydropteridine diphosphokinase [Pseudomonadota bacterium]
MTLAYVSGGSNLDVEPSLLLAARALKAAYPGARFSRVYRNPAVGFEGPDFLNFVVALPVEGEPGALKAELERIEGLCGRPRYAPKWAPRSMDLDILLFGEVVLNMPGLVIPRPQLTNWAFMLGPLAELAPDVVHPTAHQAVGELWRRFNQAEHPLHPVPLDLQSA